MKKKVYEKPMLTTEEFLAQQYVAACAPAKYEEDFSKVYPIESSFHGVIDSGPDGVSDKHYDATYDNVPITSNSSEHHPAPETEGIWVWSAGGTELYVLYNKGQNANQYEGYKATYIPKNNS